MAPGRAADRDGDILAVIRALHEGEVVSYGDIAATAGHPRQARFVGHLLASSTEPLPWWRVVAATGRLVPGSEAEQAARLRAEAVTVTAGRVRRSPHGRFARRP